MNAIVYFSNTNQSKRIAEYLSMKTGYPLLDVSSAPKKEYNRLVVVFPVYCQNAPTPIKEFLSNCQADYLALLATYGKMWHGNVLNELQRNYKKPIICGAYIPCKHSYLSDITFEEFEKLSPILEKILDNAPSSIRFPKTFKNPLADFSPNFRSRLGVKIKRTNNCNQCRFCEDNCPFHAIENGKTNKRCIRCLRCVENCPKNALTFQLSLPLRLYLKKKKCEKIVIYV